MKTVDCVLHDLFLSSHDTHLLLCIGETTRFTPKPWTHVNYPPAMLLKVVLFAYSQGIVSSRGIERACQEHVTFIALCGDTAPHFTTIAHFERHAAKLEAVAGRRADARLARGASRGPPRCEGRERTKVDGQWKLFCLVHNIDKLARHGYAA